MNTMTGTVPMDAILALLNSMSLNDRRWLAEQMNAQLELDEAKAEESWKNFMNNLTPIEDDSDERLDRALARFHKDWGGDKDPMEIAKELRQGEEMVKDVETW
ncbi:MAG: hypothetical protein K6A94_10510 [Bacteroidales bacterium]|nr:hypothetical protein [Bacteroidales bacterium]